MKYWAIALTTLAVLPVNAYVQNWNLNDDASGARRKLEGRADACPSSNPVSCAAVDSDLPSNFCCGSDTTCLSLDKSSSAICCPKGSSCDGIGTISCDVSLQDPSKNTGPIFTTNLTGTLPACGDKCCPFGYKCGDSQGNQSVCVVEQSTAGAATTTRVTSTTSATITSTPTVVASGINSTNAPPTKETNNFPAGVFFAGFFPGIVVGILATLAWVVLTKRHNKAPNTRGLNMEGNGARPFISLPIKDNRESNGRSDFLGRTRSRARSMFSPHQRSKTVDSVDFWSAKMPTPPANNNIPVNYVNDMPNVPVTPARRVARYPSEENLAHKMADEKEYYMSSEVSDANRPESIRIYSPDTSQQPQNAPPMPQMPVAAIPPLRAMNTQRRVTPPYGKSEAPQLPRRDSGTAMGTFGSPFQTPEKRPTIVRNNTPSMCATYHDASTVDSSAQPIPVLQTLTPARYDPNAGKPATLAPSAAALAASSRLSKAQQALPSQQQKPVIPPRPQNKPSKPRPETQLSDFDFDEGLERPASPVHPSSPPREAYKSQAVSNPYMQPQPLERSRANPDSTFENLLPGAQFDKARNDKHATNATTFTTMLKNVGFPDPGQEKMPAVPKLDVRNINASANGKKTKGMI